MKQHFGWKCYAQYKKKGFSGFPRIPVVLDTIGSLDSRGEEAPKWSCKGSEEAQAQSMDLGLEKHVRQHVLWHWPLLVRSSTISLHWPVTNLVHKQNTRAREGGVALLCYLGGWAAEKFCHVLIVVKAKVARVWSVLFAALTALDSIKMIVSPHLETSC